MKICMNIGGKLHSVNCQTAGGFVAFKLKMALGVHKISVFLVLVIILMIFLSSPSRIGQVFTL